MTLVVPIVGLNEFLSLGLEGVIGNDLLLKLYSNNIIPSSGDTEATFDEVAGGGYASITLGKDDWTIINGIATQSQKQFSFTGDTDAPGVIYGYYVVDGSNVLLWTERFSESIIPFGPGIGTLIKITPRFQATS